MVYPQFLSPIPSCAIAEFQPDFKEDALQVGVKIARGVSLRTPLAKGERTACEFRTAHEVTLWPLAVAEARYISGTGALGSLRVNAPPNAKAAIRLRLQTRGGAKLSALSLDRLSFYIKASGDVAARLYKQISANVVGLYVRDVQAQGQGSSASLPGSFVQVEGFEDHEAMLPVTTQGFAGYRLLQEYFGFAERFQFFSVSGLQRVVPHSQSDELDIYLLLDRAQPALENALDASLFRLYCTPIINLFHKSLDRIHLGSHETEHHLIPDRNRPLDFEVYDLQRVTGIAADGTTQVPVQPFYTNRHHGLADDQACYYTLQRRQRLYSTQQRATGVRTSYTGTECFVSLSGGQGATAALDLRQLDVQALCTNRDLPLQVGFGKGRTDLLLDGSAPVDVIRCITGPTSPRPSPAFGDTAWKLISHLSLNYLSLSDNQSGAALLRELLALYADPQDPIMARQIEGLRSISYRPVVDRVPGGGPISYGRGLRIALTLDDAAFEGAGIVTLAAVLERFFARYISINSFARTELRSHSRGEIKLWPLRTGSRPTL
jgi:type VI secretion system protein ImpG